MFVCDNPGLQKKTATASGRHMYLLQEKIADFWENPFLFLFLLPHCTEKCTIHCEAFDYCSIY